MDEAVTGAVLTSGDPEPLPGTIVRDDCGLTWERDWSPYGACWVRTDADSDPESWAKIAGNYGPVTVLEVPADEETARVRPD